MAKSYPTLCNTMDCITPGLHVAHHLSEFTQVHVHWTGDAIQLSRSLPPPSPLAFNLSQHQVLFQWVSCLHQVTKAVELQLKHQSFQWVYRVDFPQNWLVWSLCCPRDSHESFPTPQLESILWCSAFFMVQPTSIHDYWKKHSFNYIDLCQQSDVFAF